MMKSPNLPRSCIAVVLLAICVVAARPLIADPVPVRRTQGTFHGFLVLKTLGRNHSRRR